MHKIRQNPPNILAILHPQKRHQNPRFAIYYILNMVFNELFNIYKKYFVSVFYAYHKGLCTKAHSNTKYIIMNFFCNFMVKIC